ALAFRRAGDNVRADKILKSLLERLGDNSLRIGNRTLDRNQVEEEITKASPVQPAAVTDWPTVKGNASRSAQGKGNAPSLESRWPYPPWNSEATRRWLDQAIKYQEEHNQPVLPGFFPIVVTIQTDQGRMPMLVYRSHWGIHARNLSKDGKLE